MELPIRHLHRHPCRDIAGKAELADDGGEQGAFVTLDAANEIRLECVPHGARRTPVTESLGGKPKRGLEEFTGRLPAKDAAEVLSETDPAGRRMANGERDEIGPAELEKGAVANPAPRRKGKHADGVTVTHELAQGLAGFVPIDEEHKVRPDRLEQPIPALGRLRLIAAGDEIEGRSLG